MSAVGMRGAADGGGSGAERKRHMREKPSLTTSLPESCPQLSELIHPMDVGEFFGEHWEKRPRVFRNAFTNSFFADRLSFPRLLDLVQRLAGEDDALDFGLDINAARYRDGVRETPNREVANKATLVEVFNSEGCTLQLHQPQRFDDSLADLMMRLEAELGCLVGCNAYLTPKGTQGLAPHHDDVELFVCQTAGEKRWRLYQPWQGFALPAQSSADLPESRIGAPTMDITLRPGDVLYMPRGVIHQAAAQQEDSTHLTISTYQRWTWGDLASSVIQQAILSPEEPVCMPLAGRASLPPGFLYRHGVQATLRRSIAKGEPEEEEEKEDVEGEDGEEEGMAKVREDAGRLARALREMADRVERLPVEFLSSAADLMAKDFQKHRLAPSLTALPPPGDEPTLRSLLRLRADKSCFRLVFHESDGGMMLLHCLGNDRQAHMMPEEAGGSGAEDGEDSDDGEDGEEGSTGPFPVEWGAAVTQVLESTEGVRVFDLKTPEQLEVARLLFASGVVYAEDAKAAAASNGNKSSGKKAKR